jgi:DNA-binding beta-propeller fold protein YncE
VLPHPDIPYYIANFRDFSYLVTANWRNSSGHADTWAKVEPLITGEPDWDVYELDEDDTSNPGGIATIEIDGDPVVIVSYSEQDSIGIYDEYGDLLGLFEAGDYPMGIDITEDPESAGDYYALVACRDEDSVAVISLDSGLFDKWYAGNEPVDLRCVTVNDTWYCYVVNKSVPLQSVGTVTVLDWDGDIDDTIDVGVNPVALDNAPSGSDFEDRLYVVNNGSGNVYCIDMDTNTILDTLILNNYPTPASPVDVAISPVEYSSEYRRIIINTANKSYYVFSLKSSAPYHTKEFEETNAQIGGATSIHSVTVIEEIGD